MTDFVTNETRIIFMGTPDFAVPSLRALHKQSAAQGWRVVGVLTQPDRPAGRGKKLVASPVKQFAVEHGLPVQQPERLRKAPEAIDALRELAPDLIVVAAYGLILPTNVLELPTFGCLNVHASLLPVYRGASPISAAILNGDDETGASIMFMDEGLDTGPVLLQEGHFLEGDETTLTLTEQLADLGAEQLIEAVPQWLVGELPPVAQDELPGQVSICRTIKKAAGRINWTQPAIHIERMTRAYSPWPSAFTTWRDQAFKIHQASVVEGKAEPGLVIQTDAGVAVGTGDGLLLLHTVQPAGKRAMEIASFLNGAPDFVGAVLGG